MDRYDKVIRDIQHKTEQDKLQWKVVHSSLYAKVLLNTDKVLRSFICDYALDGKKYSLLFVERKADYLFDKFVDTLETRGYELLVLDDDAEIVLLLYDGTVEREDLLKLASLLDDHNDRTKRFFAAFDDANVA